MCVFHKQKSIKLHILFFFQQRYLLWWWTFFLMLHSVKNSCSVHKTPLSCTILQLYCNTAESSVRYTITSTCPKHECNILKQNILFAKQMHKDNWLEVNSNAVDMMIWWVNLTISLILCYILQVLKDVEMEHLGRRSADSVRRMSSSRHSYKSRSHKRRLGQEPIAMLTAEKVEKKSYKTQQHYVVFKECACIWIRWLLLHVFVHLQSRQFVRLFLLFFSFPSRHQHPSAINESLSTCENELVSRSLTIATLPLLVLTRRRSHSLTNDISEAARERGGACSRLASHRSDSFDSLNLGRASLKLSHAPQTVPRIIVISPTSESSFGNRDTVCGEESVKALEDNVFVSSTFSSEVFEAVELLTWQAEWWLYL